MSDGEVVDVIFRVWRKSDGGGVLALFPAIDEGNGQCSSYEHMGQHGGADYVGCIQRTRPAQKDEYAALKKELESAPYYYKLRVRNRRVKWRR